MQIQQALNKMISPAMPQIILTTMSILISAWTAYIGYIISRLWYYDGDLGPKQAHHVILTAAMKELLAKEYNLDFQFATLPSNNDYQIDYEFYASRWIAELEVDVNADADDMYDNDEDERNARIGEQRLADFTALM